MLTPILSKEICRQCKICCNYSATSLWDMPGFTRTEYEKAIQYKQDLKNSIQFKSGLFFFTPKRVNENKYLCPFLTDHGCLLGPKKPFKCAIWPLYVVKSENQIYLAVSSVCPNLSDLTSDIIKDKLRSTLITIKKYIDENPELIEEYKKHFKLLMPL